MQTWFVHLSPERCAALLATTAIGRVGVIVEGRPEVFPVNHVYDDVSGSVVFPSKPGTKLHGALDWPWVAFEIDGVDPDDGSGWSVMVGGQAEEVTDGEEIERLSQRREVLWAAGDGARWIRIVPTKVTGRRINVVAG